MIPPPIPYHNDFYLKPLNIYQDNDNDLPLPPFGQGETLEEVGFFQAESNPPLFTFLFADYMKIWKEPFNPSKGIVNIKKQFVDPLHGLLRDMAFYFDINKNNPLEIVDFLMNQGCFTLDSGELLKECISALSTFQEHDELSLEPNLSFRTMTLNQKLLLEKTYWLVLHPLYHFLEINLEQQRLNDLKLFFQQIDLVQTAFQSKFPLLPDALVRHIALHHCRTKASLETHLHYFKALSKHTKESLRECYFNALEESLSQENASEIFQILLNVPNKSGLRIGFSRNLKKLEAGLEKMTDRLENGQTVAIALPSLFPVRSRHLKHSLIEQLGEGKSYRMQFGEYDFQFKQMPYHPLMEYAIHNLTSRIAGRVTPANLLVRFDVYKGLEKKSYPVLISETIQGKSLSDEWQNIIPNQSYTWNLLCSILTHPGDGRFSNYIIDDTQNLFCLDNEYSFVELADQGKVQFCSALFSSMPLETHLDQEVLKEFAALDIDAILLGWIEDVIRKEKEYMNLFHKSVEGDFTPTILFREGALATLYLQFWSLQNAIQQALDKKETVAAGDLLNELVSLTDESIGMLVHKAYDSYHEVSDAKKRLKKAIFRTTEEPLSSIQYCKALKIEPSIEKIEKQRCYSPEEAKKEILLILNHENCSIDFKQLDRARLVQLALTQKIKKSAKKASQEEANSKVILSLAKPQGMSIKDFKEMEPKILIQTMKYSVGLAERGEITDEEKASILYFFNIFIEAIRNDDINENHPIQNSFYKKIVEGGYRPKLLFAGKWKFQKILSRELEITMNQIESDADILNAKSREELVLKRNFYRGVLAGDLSGNRYKPAGGGVNGAVLFRHLESEVKQPNFLLFDERSYLPFLGVFKPHPLTVREFKGWFDLTQWGERIKTVAGMDAKLNKKDPDCRVNNEIFAYELFYIFGFYAYIGFPTTLKFTNKNDIRNRSASFCAFIPGFDVVEKHVKVLDEKNRQYTDEELYIWQMSKIFDFLTGNMDGHEGNAFVKLDNNARLIGAVNFDYDKAFAIQLTPKIGNQYKWANLEISKRNFTEKTKLALHDIFMNPDGENKIQIFLNQAREGGEQNFTIDQEVLLRKRIEFLKKIVIGEIQQLSDLKNVSYV